MTFHLTDGLLWAGGAILGIAAADGNVLAATLAGAGFATGVIAKAAHSTADTLEFVQQHEAERALQTRSWVAQELARRQPGEMGRV